MKLVYQYMAIFFNFSPTSNHLHPLQVENCDSNSRLVVGEDDNGKFRLERVKTGFHLRSKMGLECGRDYIWLKNKVNITVQIISLTS